MLIDWYLAIDIIQTPIKGFNSRVIVKKMYLYMQSVNIDSWLSIYYTVMSFKLTSVTVRIYNYYETFCFNGTKWSYGLCMSKLRRCKTPTGILIWYNGDTHNQVITIDILHFNKYRFCMFHNKVINRFLNNLRGKLPLSLNFNDTIIVCQLK